MKGRIFDIKRFAVHDGEGIRTTIFLKGCPLRCSWCHNPEGLESHRTLWYFEKKCIHCGSCIAGCRENALSVQDGRIVIDAESCSHCEICTEICPAAALCYMGEGVTAEEVVSRVRSDLPFMKRSGGGITLSGGEPTMQSEFALELLKLLKEEGFSTCMESCMYAPTELFRKFLPLLDDVIVDIKLFDDALHQRYTQRSNACILKNFQYLATHHEHVLVRIPLIPGITDSNENIRAIAAFVHSVAPNVPLELINYNPLAPDKYRIMGREYPLDATTVPLSRARLDELHAIIEAEAVPVVRDVQID